MKKLGIVMLSFGFAGVLGVVTASSPQEALAAAACKRTEFKTEMVKAACTKGGQAEAKKAMKKFVADAKKKEAGLTCQSCHSKLAPGYDLKADGFDKFKALGGN
jgi:hypothetical protein